MATTVLCVGETMAVVSPTVRESVVTAEEFVVSSGGAESNVAGHLAAMGFHAVWLSRLGDDALGDRIIAQVESTGIDAQWVVRDPDAPTGLYVKDPIPGQRRAAQYYRSGSAASRISPADLELWPLATAEWVHLTGITAALSASCDQTLQVLIDQAPEHGYRVSFDVNYRPALWSAEAAAARCRELGDRCDTVLVGLDEATALWGIETPEDVAALFPHAARVVVKDGGVEAVEISRTAGEPDVVVRQAALDVDIVEAIGAGDAFAAGYLGALLGGFSAEERLMAGHELAAWTLGSTADFRPLRSSSAGGAR